MKTTLERLQDWFLAQCDGDWEHGQGIDIQSLDNPGWLVKITLEGTELEDVPFRRFEDRYEDETEWLRCWKEESFFHAACGPTRLEHALQKFLEWAESG